MLRSAPALWDTKCKDYRDRNKKFDEMSKIATHFKVQLDEVAKKIKSLKTQYYREMKKVDDKSKSGAGTPSEDSIWFAYRMLGFLRENNISRGSRNTIEVNSYNN